ncbi:hypothetical protein J7T55_006429 [Diaporthe amygdali]|uniref:uncharacterized protein n=1 Tax=Phomopsis amygdali TaxID=1214568 RepID=UPI0022FE10AF|nr:uncharacterized protein J7T55_006429 [Diaporthe amygdali]KAJ0125085.1 hypothetical protein J7T55_006429 [Diaporthe amygdali]
MEQLPSYQDAAGKKQWLELVAPYVDPSDYNSLCCVSRHFRRHFAPRVWKDPLAVVRTSNRDTAYDYQWYSKFLAHIREMDASTASMVAVMDFRGFAPASGLDEHQEAYNNSFRELATRLPNLRCLLLDEHPQLNLSMLSRHAFRSSTAVSLENIHLISIANCGISLPARFFGGQWLKGLVYLDMSNTPGTLGNQGALIPEDLPFLRILKLRRKNLIDLTAGAIVREFRTQLFSLDVSKNGLTDDFLRTLLEYGLPVYSNTKLRTNDHFRVEGQVRPISNDDHPRPNSRLFFVDESEWSATFSSPDRYLADPPIYNTINDDFISEEGQTVRGRSKGRERIRGDSAHDAVKVLAGGPGEEIPDALHPQHQRFHWPHLHAGTTHLHLNELMLSASAVKSFIRESPGYIEHFECDRTYLPPHHASAWQSKASYLSKAATLYALPGAAYLFRPVISSNLRVLKAHHSLVTNTPTLESRSTGELTNLWLAETHMRERLDLAYPQTFVPDMNPRLDSLTISMIPRYSTGMVTKRLLSFLRLAAHQEQAIESTRALLPFRGPPMLKGLRHIRLEFEPDAKDELGSLDNETDELDSGALVEQGTEAFSFFSESAWGPSSSPVKSKVKQQVVVETTSAAEAEDAVLKGKGPSMMEEKIDDYPFNRAKGEHVSFTISPGGDSSQPLKLVVSVWIGSGLISPDNPPAINEYMRNVCDPANREGASPATPCHVAAGVPAGSFIFERAWDSIMLPAAAAEVKLPTKAELRAMEDVVARIKAFRLESRREYAALDAERRNLGGHEYWRGRLEIVLPQGRAHSSDYWR